MRDFVSKLAGPLVLTTALVSPQLSMAQEDDKGWLTRLIEDNLSGAGRQVEISGFTGALSSRATMTRMTIADEDGIWLVLDDVVLDWSRSALLSGRFLVNELSAAEITLTRMPKTEEDPLTVEAQPFEFALPELPVSVDIGALKADRILLGESLLGQEIIGRLEAKLHLADGQGNGAFTLQRTDDGPEGVIDLSGDYSNTTKVLSFDLSAQEGAGGLVATALDLPGAPAAELKLSGKGTLEDFAAEFALRSDGQPRLAGPITLKALPEAAGHGFEAKLRGNPAPLFLPEYAEFLGENLGLEVSGQVLANGALALPLLRLEAQALQLLGSLELAADGLPEKIDLLATLGNRDRTAILLPLSGEKTYLDHADLTLKFDAAASSEWRLDLALAGLKTAAMQLEAARLGGKGTIDRLDYRRGVDGDLTISSNGLAFADPALQQAVGDRLTGAISFDWREGDGVLTLTDLDVAGADYAAKGNIGLEGLQDSMRVSGDMQVLAQNLARFGPLAGQPLGGAGEVHLAGYYEPLSGVFDGSLLVEGQGLKTGIPEADRLLAGDAKIEAAAVRDENGISLNYLNAQAASLVLSGSGTISTAGENNLTGQVAFANLADLGGAYGGRLEAAFGLKGPMDDLLINLGGQGDNLRIGQAEVDKLIAGTSQLEARLRLRQGQPVIEVLKLDGANLTADISSDPQGTMTVAARLRDLGLMLPEFGGPVTLAGRLSPQGSGFISDLQVQGPAAINTRISGLIDAANPNLAISGSSTAALANAFVDPVTVAGNLSYDLRLTSWDLAGISGNASLGNGRIAVPVEGISLENVALRADLAGGQLRLDSRADLAQGGQITLRGPLSLNTPYAADLALNLAGARLRNPELYDTALSGDITIRGPLMGRANLTALLELGETELLVPSTGFGSAADLAKVSHIRDSAAVKTTRVRAGLGGGAGGSSAGASSAMPDWGVDVTIRAPRRVFIRGRGLDAELGGEIRVGGSLNHLLPSGGLDLVRGRLDILGKRLDLTSASLTFEGDFIPKLDISAANVSGEVTSIVSIIGPADAPEVVFSSEPAMAQEEVLAYMLFDRGIEKLSAFQALQLANAVATLAGRGGEGIISRLRKGFGFDDLDVQTADDGSTSVKAGKYISENVYTEVGVGQDGNTRINLNLELKRGFTAKARVDSDGDSGIGLYLEKDY